MNENSHTFKIGLDIHGVIDTYPEYFATLSRRIKFLEEQNKNVKFEVHIITGQEREHTEPIVRNFGIYYTHFFSVVDYHKEIGTKMWMDEKKTWWMDEKDWLRTKGDYIHRNNIDIHFDQIRENAKL